MRTLTVPAPTGRVQEDSLRVAGDLAAAVGEVKDTGHAPLVFAGSCDVAPGVLIAGLADERCGVVWIDAHADFNTTTTTARRCRSPSPPPTRRC